MPKTKILMQQYEVIGATQPVSSVINWDDNYSLKEVAWMFKKKERTILNWRNEQKLKAVIFERHVLFEKKLVDIALERYKRFGFLLAND